MAALRIFSKLFTINSTKRSLRARKSGMSTVSLMIWLLTASRAMEGLSGLARIMMEMFNQILWPKDMVLLAL
jgi:hypothetical protein